MFYACRLSSLAETFSIYRLLRRLPLELKTSFVRLASSYCAQRSIVFCSKPYSPFICLCYEFSIEKWYNQIVDMRQQSKSKTLDIQSRKGGAVPTLTHQKHP